MVYDNGNVLGRSSCKAEEECPSSMIEFNCKASAPPLDCLHSQ